LQFLKIRKNSSVYREIVNSEFQYVYLLKYDGNIEDFKLTDGEVQEIKFIPIEKVKKDLESGVNKYVPHHGYWDWVLDEMRKGAFGK